MVRSYHILAGLLIFTFVQLIRDPSKQLRLLMRISLQPFACYAPEFYPELISVVMKQT